MMNSRRLSDWRISGVLAMAMLSLAGCGSAADEEPAPADGVTLGARGELAREVNDYLLAHGYFPNAELSKDFPDWVPIVAEGPASSDVFDERSLEALRAFRVNFGLPAKDQVDDEVLELMRKQQCGNPHESPFNPQDKFHHNYSGGYAYGSNLTYSIQGTALGMSPALTSATILSGFNVWPGKAAVSFTETTGASNIIVRFVPLPAGVGGRALGNSVLELNNAVAWMVPGLMFTVAHEAGHLMGLGHSGFSSALMSGGAPPTLPTSDDLAAITPNYRRWYAATETGRDVGAGASDVWRIGLNNVNAFGGAIFRRANNSASWAQVDGQATRIAVGTEPWVVNAPGNIFKRIGVTASTPQGTGWQDVSAGARAIDIGVTAGVNPWAISTTVINGYGNAILRFNGSTWDTIGGQAIRVAVGKSSVRPYVFVVNQTGQVYERGGVTFANPAGTHWVQQPILAPNIWGNETGFATDVAIAEGGIAWATGTADGVPYSFLRNLQPTAPGGPPAVALDRWVPITGGGGSIAVSKVEQPLAVSSAGVVMERLR